MAKRPLRWRFFDAGLDMSLTAGAAAVARVGKPDKEEAAGALAHAMGKERTRLGRRQHHGRG